MAVGTQPATATRPAVDTKHVTGRRTVRYNSVDDLLADAQRLAAGPHRELGNWSFGQILKHLAITFDTGIDGAPFKPSWIVRFVAKTFMKKRFLQGPISPGFKLPRGAEKFLPGPTSSEEGLAALRRAIERWKATPERVEHLVLGHLTREEWDQMELRHAEMHMSFVVPA